MQPSSLPVDRRARRAKTDIIDVEMLLRTLMAWLRGEPRVCSMVPIPSVGDEEARRAYREREDLTRERRSIVNKIDGILATLGVKGYKGHCQSKFYTACSRARPGWSCTVFAHESSTRSAGFDAENGLYLIALTVTAASVELHPGLIVLPSVARSEAQRLISSRQIFERPFGANAIGVAPGTQPLHCRGGR